MTQGRHGLVATLGVQTMTNDQKQHWDEVYAKNPEFFGDEPSIFARQALELFRENGVSSLLELGPGQGRDTVFFAENGIAVTGWTTRTSRSRN